LGIRGLNQKFKNNVFRGGHGELKAKQWLDSIEKQQRRIDLKIVRDKTDRQMDRQRDRVNDKK